MARREIDTIWDRTTRNNINENFIELYDAPNTANEAKDVASKAKTIAENAEETANESLQQSESTQQQLDSIILESGTSDAEVVQARTNERGKQFDILKDRLDNLDIEFEQRGVNVKWFGASGSDQSTTGSIASGSNELTVTDAIDFEVGQGILIEGAGPGGVAEVAELQINSSPTNDGQVVITLDGIATNVTVDNGEFETASLEVTAAPTVAGNIIVTLDGVSTNIAVDPAIETTAEAVADKIRATSFTGWTTGGTTGTTTVIFTANAVGDKTDAVYDDNGTGATGTMTTTTQGYDADTAIEIADNIRNTSFAGWTTGGTAGTDTVTFTSDTVGTKQNATFNDNGTGVSGVMTTTTEGQDGGNLVTSITAINGTVFTLADNAVADATNAVVQHDDTQAIKDALSSFYSLYFPSGSYLVSDEIIIGNRRKVVGVAGTWSEGSKVSIIKWNGATEQNKAIMRVSSDAIGVNPTTARTNIIVSDIALNGNGAVGYGLYAAYVTNESRFTSIVATNTTQHGIRVEKSWYASFSNILAKDNYGCGITVGKESWGGVNGVPFNYIRAHNNGRDSTFNEDTKKDWGYGLGIFDGSSLVFRDVILEKNNGAGVYFYSKTYTVGIDGLYLEDNNMNNPQPYGVIYIGNSAGRGHFLNNVYLAGTSPTDPNNQWIWLTGSGVGREGLVIDSVNNGRIKSEFSNYILKNASYTLTDYIEGHLPSNMVVGGYNLDTLYVRNGGNDENDGRTASTAFKTLQRAINVAKNANRVVTIDCTGANLTGEVTNIYPIDRDIVIDGGGTATIDNASSGGVALSIRNAMSKVTIQNFASISRVKIENCKQVMFNETDLIKSDEDNTEVLNVYGSIVVVNNANIDATAGSFQYSRGVVSRMGSKVVLKNSAIANFFADRYFDLYEGGEIEADSWLSVFDTAVRFQDSTGIVRGGNKIRMSGGSITLS